MNKDTEQVDYILEKVLEGMEDMPDGQRELLRDVFYMGLSVASDLIINKSGEGPLVGINAQGKVRVNWRGLLVVKNSVEAWLKDQDKLFEHIVEVPDIKIDTTH